MAKQRTYIEAVEFSAQRDKIDPECRNFDRLMENIGWSVSTNPEHFPVVEGTNARIIKTRPGAADLPGLNIYFRIENPDESCTLLWVEEAADQTQHSPLG